MELTMNEKKAVTTEVAKRYQKSSKKQKVRYWMSLLPLWGIVASMQVIFLATGEKSISEP